MSEMVERVARALCVEDGHDPDVRLRWRSYVESARGAIEALRDLPRHVIGAMETAVEDSIDSTSDTEQSWDVWDANTVANAVHRAFIDAALKDLPPADETPEEACERWAREAEERET